MGGKSSRIALGLAVAVAAFGAWSGSAAAAGAAILPNPTCCTYLPGPFTQGLGETASFDNTATTTYHDVVATAKGPDGKPLFSSPVTPGGTASAVDGTEYLTAGTYPFYCSLHGSAMSGELVVDGSSGTVVRRPRVKVSVLRQKLKRVRRVGVKVKIKAVTASKGVAITAYKGKRKLGFKRGLRLAAGKSKRITLKLTKAGRASLRRGKAVRIKVKAAVPFGKTARASRRVR